ncbi:AAEL001512-PA [Aedes aegypti]|uniref:AAEL001512-PA n=1 Tax=Aedes aegypti TaxID=7159 RepID=Q17L05_AEDAE|nr:AAEL001512-PA [Aedes aegypti]
MHRAVRRKFLDASEYLLSMSQVVGCSYNVRHRKQEIHSQVTRGADQRSTFYA